MSYFLLLSDTEMETVAFAMNATIRDQRRQLGQIHHERITRQNHGDTHILEWKAERYDVLIRQLARLETLNAKIDAAPNGDAIKAND